jgi:hypothetical protein
MPEYYYDEIEYELYEYDDSDDEKNCRQDYLSLEDWQDWNSRELLNLWMSIVEYHEMWYLPLHKTFNQFCEFLYYEGGGSSEEPTTTITTPPEVQAIHNHPWIKNMDWSVFFL